MYDSGAQPARRGVAQGRNWPIKLPRRNGGYSGPSGPADRPVLPSLQSRLLARALRRLIKPRQVTLADIPLIRALMVMLTRSRLPDGIRAVRVRWPVAGEWLHPPQPRRGRALLYLHGGGFICGNPQTHRSISARLAMLLQVSVFVPDYPLAPEHPYPAAPDAVLLVWRWLLEQGFRADRLLLAGDSAGGGLALTLMQDCRRLGLPLPAAAALFSPWTDLTCSSPALQQNAERCAWFSPQQLHFAARLYAGSAHPANPRLSPLHGDLSGLPPLHIHVSDSEMLRDDSLQLAERARVAGTPLQLTVWHSLPHAWPNFAGLMPEADSCLAQTAAALTTSPALAATAPAA